MASHSLQCERWRCEQRPCGRRPAGHELPLVLIAPLATLIALTVVALGLAVQPQTRRTGTGSIVVLRNWPLALPSARCAAVGHDRRVGGTGSGQR
jgi:hypothetical protein